MDNHGGPVNHAGIDPGGELIEVGPDGLFRIVFGSEVSDSFLSTALPVEVLVASRDLEGDLFSVTLVTKSDIVIEELPPSSEKHGEVEFVGNHDISIEFGYGFTKESGVR